MNKKKIITLTLSNNGSIAYVAGNKYPKPKSYDKIKKDDEGYSLCIFGDGWIFVQENAAIKAVKAIERGKLAGSLVYEESNTIPWPQSKAFLGLAYKDGKLVKRSYAVSQKTKLTKEQAEKILGKVTLVEIEDEKFYVSEVSRIINEKLQHCEGVMPILALNADAYEI